MDYVPKRVVVCQEGTFGPTHYADFVESIKAHLGRALYPLTVGKPRVHLAEVVVVVTAEEAEQKAQKGQVDIVIFVSVSMVTTAHRIRANHPSVAVIVITGTDVPDEPYIVHKRMIRGGGDLVALVNAV